MRSTTTVTSLLAAGAAFAIALAGPAQSQMTSGAAKPKPAAPAGDQALIASAMKAAPMAVAKDAAVIDMGGGKMRMVRKGTNGFTCVPDNPATPGPDPMCADKNAMDWMSAMLAKKPPPKTVGFIYMLAGGTDASNTDPYATKPTAKNHWIKTGPHVMVVGAPELLKNYPASPDPNTASPYVMWAGTPYAHLMAPVR